MFFTRVRRRFATAMAAGAAIAVAAAAPAAAHVTLNPNTAAPGAYASFSVRVPNEEADANTTKLELYLPTDHPIASVSVQPTPGWKAAITTSTLPKPVTTRDGQLTEAVTQITWTGGVIAPHQFQSFNLLLGPLPTGVDVLYFKALQTYSDGNVVRWIEIPNGDAKPSHPAPSITLTSADPSDAAAASGGHDGTALGLGIAALVIALLGLAAGVTALRRLAGGST